MTEIIKDTLVSKLSDKTGYRKAACSMFLEAFMEIVAEEIGKKNTIRLTGFGVFEPKKMSERTGRNVHTNEAVKIPERYVPFFRPGKLLKEALNAINGVEE